MLGWFSAGGEDSIRDLIARKRYPKAIELLRAELHQRRGDRRLRMQLGDVLAQAGRKKEALEVLGAVADDLALAGQAAQAIAVLKKMQVVDPGRTEVEDKLAYLIAQRSRPANDPWTTRVGDDGVILPEQPVEEIGFDDIGTAPEVDQAASRTGEGDARMLGAPVGRPATAGDIGLEGRSENRSPDDTLSPEAMRNELVAMIEVTLGPDETPAAPQAVPQASPPPVAETPLFKSFSREELVPLIRGLRLLTFEPGQIVVSEGESGGSLFVVTTGRLRAHVKSPGGRNVEIREIQEGDFFGEISILSGGPRSATVTAAARSELLELDRSTLAQITATHPHVFEVLKEFYEHRRDSSLETLVRQMGAAPVQPGP